MNAPVKTGGTVRSNLEAAAGRNVAAFAILRGPQRPVSLRHLWQWHLSLQIGLGGDGAGGKGILDWVKFDAWARWTGARPYAHEVIALFQMDVIARNPDALKEIDP